MNSSIQGTTTRREFIKTTGKLAAVSALANATIPSIHAAGSDLIQVALIGCGGRGGGAAANALSVKRGPVKLVAMADIFPERLEKDLNNLQQQYASQVDVPRGSPVHRLRRLQKAMDCLKPGDIAIFATPPAFRWVHFTYAIQKGLNVFMEKPLTADGPTSKRMLSLAQDASAKNLKVGVGLMSRHSRALQELAKRVHDGEIGQIILQRGYRMHGPGGYFLSLPKPAGDQRPALPGEALPQLHLGQRRLLQRLLYPHHRSSGVDEKRVAGQGSGAGRPALPRESGRSHVRGSEFRHLFSGIHVFRRHQVFFRRAHIDGCEEIYSSYLHGTKGMGIASKSGDCGQPSSLYTEPDDRPWPISFGNPR